MRDEFVSAQSRRRRLAIDVRCLGESPALSWDELTSVWTLAQFGVIVASYVSPSC